MRLWMFLSLVALSVPLHSCGDDAGVDQSAEGDVEDAGNVGEDTRPRDVPTDNDQGLPDGPLDVSDVAEDLSEDVPPDTADDIADVDGDVSIDVPSGQQWSLRFYGNGGLYDDRVRIRLDDPATDMPGPPLDVGGADFTIEFWMKARANDNDNSISCGPGIGWVESNIIVDRDRHSQTPTFGIGLAGGRVIFAVLGPDDQSYTLCGSALVLDEQWHHVAVTRTFPAGVMRIFVDGMLDAEIDGPDGDISYPDDGEPLSVCPGGLCDYSDPFLVFGAEKHGYEGISYNGMLDEVRISTTLRYLGAYDRPAEPWQPDAHTVALFHFDEGSGETVLDASGNDTHGSVEYGGDPPGPEWVMDSPFSQ